MRIQGSSSALLLEQADDFFVLVRRAALSVHPERRRIRVDAEEISVLICFNLRQDDILLFPRVPSAMSPEFRVLVDQLQAGHIEEFFVDDRDHGVRLEIRRVAKPANDQEGI